MIAKGQILVFRKSADTLYLAADYTLATILYFKTLFAIPDFLLLDKVGEKYGFSSVGMFKYDFLNWSKLEKNKILSCLKWQVRIRGNCRKIENY
tara:strand:+ start:282 stop:563 length:282 start_codon:yes stop_codon:yes gene_type:complete